MNSEKWEKVELNQIANIFDCPHSTPNWTDSGVFVIRSWNVRGGRLNFDKTSFTDEKSYLERVRRAKLEFGDLVLTREAPMGEVCMIPEKLKCCLGQRVVLIKPIREKVDPYYLLYSCQSVFVQNQIMASEGTGSTVSNLRIPLIEALKIPLPNITIQRRIASILSALDDKIELNRRMNETLEGIAQAVWGEWFGKYASGEKELPEGWRTGTIFDIANLIGGGTPKTGVSSYWEGGIPWISAKDITPNNRQFIIETEKTISREGLINSSAKLLPAYSTVVSARGTVGNYCIISEEMAISQSNYALKAKIENADYYLFLQLGNMIDEMKQKSYGTVFDTITTKTFAEIEIIIPAFEKINCFEKIVKPFFQMRLKCMKESHFLAQTRDTLLPKLMNGEIRII